MWKRSGRADEGKVGTGEEVGGEGHVTGTGGKGVVIGQMKEGGKVRGWTSGEEG